MIQKETPTTKVILEGKTGKISNTANIGNKERIVFIWK